MGYATFKQAKEFIHDGLGTCEDSALADAVNMIRHEWYNWYAELALFMDAVECFRVQKFCFDCNACRDSYRGITLPREVQQVEAMWHNDWPVTLRSAWREHQTGITPECDCRLEKFDMPGSFSTLADIPFNCAVELIAVATHPDDVGKVLKIRGLNSAGVPAAAEITLGLEPSRTADSFKFIDGRGGILKPVTTGRVILSDCHGRVYGIYEPDEIVPTYRRIKISGLPGDCEAVNVRASRRYVKLYGDDDVVETDNTPAWDAMARYLRLYKRTDKDGVTMKAESAFLAKARAMLEGEKSRDIGKATSGNVKIKTATFRGHRLHRFGGGRRY